MYTWAYFDEPPRHGFPPLADGDPYLVRTADGFAVAIWLNGRFVDPDDWDVPVEAEAIAVDALGRAV